MTGAKSAKVGKHLRRDKETNGGLQSWLLADHEQHTHLITERMRQFDWDEPSTNKSKQRIWQLASA